MEKPRLDFVAMVANQMMKGPNFGWPDASDKQKELFKLRHQKQIEWIISMLPKTSAAVPAVLVKCLIRFGPEKVIKFCKTIKNGSFDGIDDPAHMLWKFMLGQNGRRANVVQVYRKTCYALKAYMEDKRIDGIREAKSDIFNWDEDYTVPDEYLANWKPDEIPQVE